MVWQLTPCLRLPPRWPELYALPRWALALLVIPRRRWRRLPRTRSLPIQRAESVFTGCIMLQKYPKKIQSPAKPTQKTNGMEWITWFQFRAHVSEKWPRKKSRNIVTWGMLVDMSIAHGHKVWNNWLALHIEQELACGASGRALEEFQNFKLPLYYISSKCSNSPIHLSYH
jgi:hypothetical protein